MIFGQSCRMNKIKAFRRKAFSYALRISEIGASS